MFRSILSKALIIFGFFFLLGVAGEADYESALGVYGPITKIIIKAIIGLVIMGTGLVLERSTK